MTPLTNYVDPRVERWELVVARYPAIAAEVLQQWKQQPLEPVEADMAAVDECLGPWLAGRGGRASGPKDQKQAKSE